MQFSKIIIIKVLIIFITFFLFFSNAVGLLEMGWITKPDIFISSNFSNLGEHSVLQLEVFSSPEFFCLVIIGTILTFVLPMLNPVMGSLLTFVCMIPPFMMQIYADRGLFFSGNMDPLIPLEYTFLMILVLFVVNNLVSLFTEMRHKRLMLESFSHFVPPQIAEQIAKDPANVNMKGQAREMTVMFTDLVSFTDASERLNSAQVTSLLNAYFNEMTDVIYQFQGTIDKYMGDSIMAFWNAPITQTDHANRAIETCFEMHKRIEEISADFKKRGWPAPEMSIGINTGMMNVGNMGSKYRIAYTVIGDAVNTASRIENLTRFYKVPTIVTKTTMESASGFLYRELDQVAVKGKKNKVQIYEPVCKKGEANESILKKIQNHEIALKYYFNGNWIEARQKFENLLFDYRDDYYEVMISIIDREYQMYLR